ncbi:hypothetical protein UB31_21655 [Bradyrhizobium sp. LTSP849]|uniref:hypothetical protein n=1 Tax=Bradyrhizobium sp. LTSP849 TaxID=1615890 RepID=UPI0005D21715|nr:hypothetical protein [Bradyrhizobium sp. LTSP849]KJC44172.1 hypothetical protein UB31_21655 [Bradyrhizobium sp. LTSP849]
MDELDDTEEMLDLEHVPGRFCDLLQYSFRFDQILGLKGFDGTSKFGLQFTAKPIPPSDHPVKYRNRFGDATKPSLACGSSWQQLGYARQPLCPGHPQAHSTELPIISCSAKRGQQEKFNKFNRLIRSRYRPLGSHPCRPCQTFQFWAHCFGIKSSTGRQIVSIGAHDCGNRWEYSSENTRFEIDQPK